MIDPGISLWSDICMNRILPVAVLLFLLPACGSGGDTTADAEDSQGPGSEIVHEVGFPDTGILPTDVGAAEVPMVDPGTEAGPSIGEKGWPCVHGSLCAIGICAETPEGQFCTESCETDKDCDPGLACGPVSPTAVISVCLHLASRLCQPCLDSAGCQVYTMLDATGMDCVDLAGQSHCLMPCDAGGMCPDGFDCTAAGDGRAPEYCLPSAGSCACSPLGIQLQLTGSCSTANEWGICEGLFHCMEDGQSDCDADTPGYDWCNGEDDDCDGQTDEDFSAGPCTLENTFGSCSGVKQCEEGTQSCTAQEPGPEECNGVDDDCNGATDEGFQDLDFDGLADCVDPDKDGDGIANDEDNCPEYPNADQKDTDGDGEGDFCDPDGDNDLVPDWDDNCPFVVNADQTDTDLDGLGDPCDEDRDGDGVPNTDDNCPGIVNPLQEDTDLDGSGDVCDPDVDGDGTDDPWDNCPEIANPLQEDTDLDGSGDACDPDDDNDFVADGLDNCPLVMNPYQSNLDGDDMGDACDPDEDGDNWPNETDNCPKVPNPGQQDENGNGVGDLCEPDFDGDGIIKDEDVCPLVPDPEQLDTDGDGEGDACDCDIDGDGVANPNPFCLNPPYPDNCPLVPNAGQADQDGNGLGDTCDSDLDGDGVPNEDDCEPNDGTIFPGNVETCNGVDDDCDGSTDGAGTPDCINHYPDPDNDGYGSGEGACVCGPSPQFPVSVGGDCGPMDPAVNPEQTEACTNKDDNCDGTTDPENAMDCKTYYVDGDDDGWGTTLEPTRCLCWGDPATDHTTTKVGDCNDLNPLVHPEMVELCNGVDDDCNVQADPEGSIGCVVLFKDSDQDGFGVSDASKCLCGMQGFYTTLVDGDCDDTNSSVNPDQTEACDSVDTDCNGQTDEAYAIGCTTYFTDTDNDGYGVTPTTCLCAPSPQWHTADGGDCDDEDKEIHPFTDEVCGDGKDNDCNGATDEGC